MTNASRHQNRLAAETSPYLLQHAGNPVDWYPWGEDALTVAKQEDKAILLSIGYSACHWCHVMAHESFEDGETAALMNRLFVNVKVDREERPDIDRIYQTAHQLLAQRPGGWPLTMFLDPHSQRPFFGGTYFPKEPRYGMPAFRQLIERVAAYFAEHRDEVRSRGKELQEIFGRLTAAPRAGTELGPAPIALARQQMGAAFDRDCGGFGGAPKFPQPAGLERLLRHWRDSDAREPDLEALSMVSLTLTRMAEGGLQDHLAGGFYRYAVDRAWQIPHFEKMLYDNGSLLASYAQAFLATGEPLFGRAAGAAADWLLADLQAPEGGFFASRDADSAGEEGRFYVWSRDEARRLLPDAAYEPFARRFGLDADANFEGRWHLSVRRRVAAIAEELDRGEDDVRSSIEAARATLLEARGKRLPPGRDEKQLASWNALAIRGLAMAANALERADLATAAARAADFVADRMAPGGRLCASYKDGRARFPAYLDDHAFLLDALLELLQCDWQRRHLAFAVRLADTLLDRFFDADQGGFFFTAHDHEALMHRPKPLADEALPSGNGIAALALQRLGFLLGEPRYLEAAERTLHYAWQAMQQYPHAHVTLISALAEYLEHPEIIIIRGEAGHAASWRDHLRRSFAPRRLVFAIDNAAGDLPGALAAKRGQGREPIAYRCVGDRCSLPITSREALAALLRTPGNSGATPG